MSETQTHVIWDCRCDVSQPTDTWKKILKISGGKPASLLVLQTQGSQLPAPLCTVMRMTFSKIFVGDDALEFCFLELCLLLNANPESRFIILSDDLNHFCRAFRLSQPEDVMFITKSKLQWPLSSAQWLKNIQFHDQVKTK